jgi:hypothetical protein
MPTDFSLPARAVEYGELAQRIGYLALRADQAGAHGAADALVKALPALVASLGEHASRELDAVRMELAKAVGGRDAD